MEDEIPSKIILGDKGDVVEIDIDVIGSIRGYELMKIYRGEQTPNYYSDIILASAKGHVTPHEIDADWIERNVYFANAVAACKSIVTRSTLKNEKSPAQNS